MHRFFTSRKGGTGEGGWGHPQGDMHMVAVVAVCRNTLVGTGWDRSCLVCTNGLRNCYSHLAFLAVKVMGVCWPRMLNENMVH